MDDSDNKNWFLRIASGVVFGPVPTKALRLWAEQGRVQPGNEISIDRKNWIPAQSLEELDIVWYLEDNQGNLTGPFNKRAAEKLITDGRVGEGTSIIHKDEADLAHLVRPAIESRRRPAQSEDVPELDFGSDDNSAESDVTSLRTECEGLRLRIEVLEKSQKQLLAAAEKECKSHERQLAAEHEKITKLESELEEARLGQSTALNATKETEKKYTAQIAKLKEDYQKKLDAAKETDSENKSNCEMISGKLKTLETDYAELLSFSNKRDAESLEHIAVLEEQSARREKAAAELERRCAELEKKCSEISKNTASQSTLNPVQSGTAVSSDRFVAMQIEYLTSMFNDGQKHQKLLQERIDELVNIRSNELADAVERQAKQRADKSEIKKTKEELESLKLEYGKLQEQAGIKEQELKNRIRMLEIDLSQTKTEAREADELRHQVRQLTDAVNDRDKMIARERTQHAEEHQQLQQAQQTLITRLETIENSRQSPPPAEPQQQASPHQKAFHATPWMRFKN